VTVQTRGSTDEGPATSKTVVLDSLDQESLDTAGSYHERVANLYRAHIALSSAEPAGLREALLATPAGKVQGATGKFFNKYVVVMLDHKLLGEASSRPLQRLPAFSQTDVHQLYEVVRARFETETVKTGDDQQVAAQEVLRTRRGGVSVGQLPEGDLHIVLDGGRDGGEGKPLFYFMGRMNKVIRKFTVYKTTASATSRMQRVRPAFGTMRLTERMHVISKTAPKLPVMNFLHYPDLNSSGDVVGPVKLPKPDQMWSLPWPLKKLVLADAIQSSGDRPDLGEDPEEIKWRADARANNSSEPVFFHALPVEFFEDMFRVLQAAAVIDLTAGDGAAAVAAAKLRLLYFGLTLSADHEQQLAARIKQQLINAMATEGDALYEPALVAALLQEKEDEDQEAGADQDPGTAKPKAKAKAKAKGKAKGKAKAKGKPAAPGADHAAGEGDGEGENEEEEEAELGDPFETEGY